jgi:hypothetical protein
VGTQRKDQNSATVGDFQTSLHPALGSGPLPLVPFSDRNLSRVSQAGSSGVGCTLRHPNSWRRGGGFWSDCRLTSGVVTSGGLVRRAWALPRSCLASCGMCYTGLAAWPMTWACFSLSGLHSRALGGKDGGWWRRASGQPEGGYQAVLHQCGYRG